eukprot:5167268-Pyramimonas_sp.AAC.1
MHVSIDGQAGASTDYLVFFSNLGKLNGRQIDWQTAETQQEDETPKQKKKQNISCLRAYRSAWHSAGARKSSRAIADPLGQPILCPREGAHALAERWGQVHADAPADQRPLSGLPEHVRRAPENVGGW